jgi:uncharacterized protein
MLNYHAERAALADLVPRGTELDEWQGRTYLSVVGFLFRNTRVLGVPVPFHRNFEEVNLRFYVRRPTADGWRRAVVFIKEIVPRAAVAVVARALYNENYVALPMAHEIRRAGSERETIESVTYSWRFGGLPYRLSLSAGGDPRPLVAGSEEEFIADHYWGYTSQVDGGTREYHVDHPPWRVAPARHAQLDGDIGRIYGDRFAEFLRVPPVSAFMAAGSEVVVSRGVRLAG